jgi:menaquinone-dependent protoporphyrinogen oxidase
MKAIIIYESLHGSTEKCAKLLGRQIKSDIKISRLRENEDIEIEEYDTVIIGGSIHHGVIQTRIENFILKNQSKLLEKKLGLYLCCMEEGQTALDQFAKAYPGELRKKAHAKGIFGGEFNLSKMSFFEKKLTRKLIGVKSSVSKINEEEIMNFAQKMNQ